MLKFFRKELIALIAEFAAFVTVIGQLASEVAVPKWLETLLVAWRAGLTSLWQPVFQSFNMPVQAHLASALSLAVCLMVLGVGARMARSRSRSPLAPIDLRFLEDMNFPSLLIYAGLVYAFLIGAGPNAREDLFIPFYGSELTSRYICALIVTIGYIVGDFIGHKAFHWRLIRLAVVCLAVIVGLIFATGLPAA